jgi:hypothetical protein
MNQCATCYGTGEVVLDHGATACPDCFGEGKGSRIEWRLRELEQQYASADVKWLIHELRKSRETLLLILTLCQDAGDSSELAREIQYRANETLGLYAEVK